MQRWYWSCSGTWQKAFVAVKWHEREVACAVIVYGTCVFVGKGIKTKHGCDGFIIASVISVCQEGKSSSSLGIRPSIGDALLTFFLQRLVNPSWVIVAYCNSFNVISEHDGIDLRVLQNYICSQDRCIWEVHHWKVLQQCCVPTCRFISDVCNLAVPFPYPRLGTKPNTM